MNIRVFAMTALRRYGPMKAFPLKVRHLLPITWLLACSIDAYANERTIPAVALSAITTEQASIQPSILLAGLDHPWGMDFIDDKRMLVTERSGRLSVVQLDGGSVQGTAQVSGLPKIWTGGQSGLLDVAWHKGWVYVSYSEPGKIPLTNSTAVMKAKLRHEANTGRYQLTDQQRLFQQLPKYASRAHFGSRLVFDRNDHLYITLGDRFFPRDDAQTLDNHHGKMIRIQSDGRIPTDNPYRRLDHAMPDIWSIGHRNPQGAAFNPATGELWIHEHGPKGGDELNRIEPGKNYGWPVITYGREYHGSAIGEGTEKAGMEQPLHYWVPSIAPSGMVFYQGQSNPDVFPNWQGDLFIGSLKFRQLVRLEINNNQITEEERIDFPELNERIRDVAEGPDGFIYLLTDENDGKLIRLQPYDQAE
jgi:glucose/arabinose dehydrogenase